ncbi:MAG: hypothetical protein JWO63_1957, partial [Frankiales bacterium]|nr:hypothetical protein [Frankiales bacterium]
MLASNSALVGAFEDGASVDVTAVASTAELTPAAVLVAAELLAEPPSADVLEAAELLLDPPLPAEVLIGAALLVGAVLLG